MQGSRIVLDNNLASDAAAPGSARRAAAPPARADEAVGTSSVQLATAPQLRGARIVVESLILEGVDVIFGYPGGSILHVYDELYKVQDRLRHILVRHEQGAVHAAEGYAQSTGKVGVAMVTSGPGATGLRVFVRPSLIRSRVSVPRAFRRVRDQSSRQVCWSNTCQKPRDAPPRRAGRSGSPSHLDPT